MDLYDNMDLCDDRATGGYGDEVACHTSEGALGGYLTSVPHIDDSEPPTLSGFDQIFGTWLDDCLYIQGDGSRHLLGVIHQRLRWHVKSSQRLPRRSDYRDNFEKLVECVVANGLRAIFFRDSGWVAYSRQDQFYVGRNPWISGGALARAIDLLADAEVVEAIKGERGGASSTYRLRPQWFELARNDLVGPEHIKCSPPQPQSLIVLRAVKEKTNGGRGKAPGIPLRFTPTAETKAWAAQIDRYNHFIEDYDVALQLTPENEQALVDRANAQRSPERYEPFLTRPELFSRHLVRIFNDNTFNHGGRLYRAWWITTPGDLRKHISIDNEPTVELDYSGFVVRSIYHQHDIDYKEDPYDISEIADYAEHQGYRRDYYRPYIKRLVSALLNGDGDESHPERLKLAVSFLPRFKRPELESLIANEHPFIAKLFRTGEGKRNQRLDSDIALGIITRLMDKETLALPIHDSFIVKSSREEALRELMIEEYRRHLSFDPIISSK